MRTQEQIAEEITRYIFKNRKVFVDPWIFDWSGIKQDLEKILRKMND